MNNILKSECSLELIGLGKSDEYELVIKHNEKSKSSKISLEDFKDALKSLSPIARIRNSSLSVTRFPPLVIICDNDIMIQMRYDDLMGYVKNDREIEK